MTLLLDHLLGAGRLPLEDILNFVIFVVIVVLVPLARGLIKFFSPKPREESDGLERPVPPPPPRPRARPVAQPLPPERFPNVPPPMAQPLPSARREVAPEPVRPFAAELPPARPAAAPTDSSDSAEASPLPEVLLEMLGVPVEEMRRRVLQERQAQQQRRQQRRKAAPPPSSPRGPSSESATRSSVARTKPHDERHVGIHQQLPSESRLQTTLRPVKDAAPPRRGAVFPLPDIRALAHADRGALRRIMLLQEVLGPPVSLRDPLQ